MNELEMLRERLEKAKIYYSEMEADYDIKLASANNRALATVSRKIRPTCDSLFVIKNAVEDAIGNRKTSMTQMQNILRWTEKAIENLKEAGVYTDPGCP